MSDPRVVQALRDEYGDNWAQEMCRALRISSAGRHVWQADDSPESIALVKTLRRQARNRAKAAKRK